MTAVQTSILETHTRSLKMHNKLLMDVIQRQAGTLDKAILECCMNSVEAGAKQVNLTVATDPNDSKTKLLRIVDDGRGFRSFTEIEQWFETFGTPHEESEGKVWAQFRMGRGQVMSFGKNTWRSGQFAMTVDIKNKGLEYDLAQGLEEYPGCIITVDFYDQYVVENVEYLKEEVRKQIRYMELPVYFNGERLTVDSKNCKWSYEDEQIKAIFGAGTDLKVYNLGVYVKTIPESTSGIGGVVVSKQQLKVNFARNDIQYNCPIYKHIMAVTAKQRIKKVYRKAKSLTDSERIAALRDVRDHPEIIHNEYRTVGLLFTSSGNVMPLNTFLKRQLPWCFAPEGDARADRLNQREEAICLDESMLDSVAYTRDDPAEFFDWLLSSDPHYTGVKYLYRPFEKLAEALDDTCALIPERLLLTYERRVLKALTKLNCWEGRTLVMGLASCARAWTDGSTYIAMDRKWLADKLRLGGSDDAHLLAVLTHELAHSEDSSGTHVHGPHFFKRFHDLTLDYLNSPVRYAGTLRRRLKNQLHEDRKAEELQKKAKQVARLEKRLLGDLAQPAEVAASS